MNISFFDTVFFAPYGTHVKEFWDRRNEPNILFITYENLKQVRCNRAI